MEQRAGSARDAWEQRMRTVHADMAAAERAGEQAVRDARYAGLSESRLAELFGSRSRYRVQRITREQPQRPVSPVRVEAVLVEETVDGRVPQDLAQELWARGWATTTVPALARELLTEGHAVLCVRLSHEAATVTTLGGVQAAQKRVVAPDPVEVALAVGELLGSTFPTTDHTQQ